MVDQNKIILMSKIAVYEKRYLQKDQKITDYFVEDYVYINNFITRLGISLIIIGFIGMGALKIVCKEIIFPTSMQEFIDVYIKAYIGPWIGMLILYTLISTITYSIRYKRASKRFSQYKKLIGELNKYEN